MDPVQFEGIEEPTQLVDHAFVGPESDIVQGVGLPGTELVVQHHRPLVGEGFQRFQVVVDPTRAAVDSDERDRPATTDDAVPDATTGDRCVAFADFDSGSHDAPQANGGRRDNGSPLSVHPRTARLYSYRYSQAGPTAAGSSCTGRLAV